MLFRHWKYMWLMGILDISQMNCYILGQVYHRLTVGASISFIRGRSTGLQMFFIRIFSRTTSLTVRPHAKNNHNAIVYKASQWLLLISMWRESEESTAFILSNVAQGFAEVFCRDILMSTAIVHRQLYVLSLNILWLSSYFINSLRASDAPVN